MRHSTQYRWFLTYLLSYIAVLLVPLIVLNGIYGSRVNRIYQDEILNSVTGDIDVLSEALDGEVSSMMRTVRQLGLMLDFNQYDFERNPLSARPVKDTLSAYCSTNRFVSDIVLYLYDDAYLVSTTSSCRAEYFGQLMYQFPSFTAQNFLEQLNSLEYLTILPSQSVQRTGNTEQYLTVLVPIYTDYAVSRGVCIFLVQASSIEQRIQEKLGGYNASVYLSDRTGQLLFASHPLDMSGDTLADFTQQASQKTSMVTVGGEKYLSCSAASGDLGLRCTVFIPQEQDITRRLNHLATTLQTSTLVVLALVGVVVFLMMKLTYSPLSRLRKKAASLSSGRAQPAHGELETIDSTLDFLNDQNLSLTAKLEGSLSTARNVRLQKLLTGRYATREEFNADCAEMGLSLPCNTFFVTCALCQGGQVDWDLVPETLRELLPGSITSYYVFTPEPNRLYFIHSTERRWEDGLSATFEEARAQTEEETGLSITLGIGSLCEGTAAIPKSFLEAGSALDYRFVKGNRSTILFREILSTGGAGAAYPRQGFEKLRNAIAAQREPAIDSAVNDLIDYINKNQLPLFVAKGLCFDILRLFVESQPESAGLYSAQASLFALSDMDTAGEVVKIIAQLRDSSHHGSVPGPGADSAHLLDDVLAYVNTNCLRCDFSVQETAEKFGMLLPNLSQFFKEQTGQNILDYATNLRMERAKQLLADTDIPLKELGYQVGYYNVSSFIRRFKQTQGVTPGDYRRLHAGESAAAPPKS